MRCFLPLLRESHLSWLSPLLVLLITTQTTSTAYEDMQSQNGRLLKMLTERDEAQNQMLADRVKVGDCSLFIVWMYPYCQGRKSLKLRHSLF